MMPSTCRNTVRSRAIGVSSSEPRRTITETTTYRLTIPWFGWLFKLPVGQVIRRRISHRGFWSPPDRLDTTQVLVIGLLAAASMSAAFVNTLFTQTAEFAADDFGVGDAGVGYAGAIVRAGIIFALPAAVLADRIGRRRVIVAVAWIAPILVVDGRACTEAFRCSSHPKRSAARWALPCRSSSA